jgi:outer membrane protein OmpA-like peptidoglycan-associated protein
LGQNKDDATLKWKATRLGLTFDRFFGHAENKFNFSAGLGGGLMVWKILDPTSDTVLEATSSKNQTVDYSASEIFLSLRTGLHLGLSPKVTVALNTNIDYLTSAGADFAEPTKSARDKWQLGTALSFRFGFGGHTDVSWQPVRPMSSGSDYRGATVDRVLSSVTIDSDLDGVPDEQDDCPFSAAGVRVDRNGCPLDSDFDGVPDGLDDCPNTDRAAGKLVDVYGCAIDSDFDGIPDFTDKCPQNKVGAKVDNNGCPIDTDNDGVPDGLDDCPFTLQGVDVDPNGCIDLAIIDKPLVLNINYIPGSFEVDPHNIKKLKRLARLLNFVKDVRMDINGYTDNIGTSLANRKLSERRAGRVKQYLVSFGLEATRVKVFGHGEIKFVASNDTAAGRNQNRRIEIVFYK